MLHVREGQILHKVPVILTSNHERHQQEMKRMIQPLPLSLDSKIHLSKFPFSPILRNLLIYTILNKLKKKG